MKNYTATAMALALVAGVVGLAFAPIAAATHNNCDNNETLTYGQSSSDSLGSSREVVIFMVDVPENDPVLLLPIEQARLKIDVTSGSGDVAWVVSELVGGNCQQVDSGADASDDIEKLLDPDATYFIKTTRSTGTSSVDFDIIVETHSFV